MKRKQVLERTNLPTFLTLFKNVICIKTSVCPNVTLVGNSIPILKHSHMQNNVSNKRIVGSLWSFTILNFNCVGTTANSCISRSRNFIVFLYFIHLRQKLNSLHDPHAVLVSPDHARPRLPIGSLASPVLNCSPLVRPVSLPWVTDSYITARFLLLGLLIALMMEAARTSETLVNFYQTTRCYNPEDSNLRR
jgi:hypothetical protein